MVMLFQTIALHLQQMINLFRNNHLLRGMVLCLYLLVYISFHIEVSFRNQENQILSFNIPSEQSTDCEEESEFSVFEDAGLHQVINALTTPNCLSFYHSKIKHNFKPTRGFCYCWSPPPW